MKFTTHIHASWRMYPCYYGHSVNSTHAPPWHQNSSFIYFLMHNAHFSASSCFKIVKVLWLITYLPNKFKEHFSPYWPKGKFGLVSPVCLHILMHHISQTVNPCAYVLLDIILENSASFPWLSKTYLKQNGTGILITSDCYQTRKNNSMDE